jgi:hypothetical protein
MELGGISGETSNKEQGMVPGKGCTFSDDPIKDGS